MAYVRIPGDRTIDSTDTNEFANGMRDENALAEDLVAEIPDDDILPDAINELSEDPRPLYDEQGAGPGDR